MSALSPHARRILAMWLASVAVSTPLIVFVLGPHLPPGDMTQEASEQTSANIVMTAVCTPVVLLIVVYFVYALIVFRARGAAIEDGAPVRGHTPTQTLWLVLTSATVLALAIWGSLVLVVSAHGAGGGQGSNPESVPPHAKQALQVQVIGQQWNWTYRFPQAGGLESDHLALPTDTLVEFHVTSLDVTHSFWAYELGVKADAVAGTDNIAFVHTHRAGTFQIRCAELCGLWHAHMYQTGRVLDRAAWTSWLAAARAADARNLKYLPPYGPYYFPDPLRRAG